MPTLNWRLDDRFVLVTGGTQGIGAATVEAMVERGAQVMVVARSTDDLAAMVAQYRVQGTVIETVAADVADADARSRIVEAIRTRWGRLDVLVNNAGTNLRKPTLDYTLADLRSLLAVNLESAWALSMALHPLLKASGCGSVVNMSSVAAHQAVRTSTAAYAISKAGMDGMTRFLASEWGPDNIRVNSIAPWYIRTPLAEAVLADPVKRDRIVSRTPLGRVGEPEEVAAVVCFLAMSGAAYITGVDVPVDGGFLVLGT